MYSPRILSYDSQNFIRDILRITEISLMGFSTLFMRQIYLNIEIDIWGGE